jgi:hypothetical protein
VTNCTPDATLERFGTPQIFNTDQGPQFTSDDWLEALKATCEALHLQLAMGFNQ